MNTKYYDLINQTFYFPQEEFTLNKDELQFHGIDMMKLVEQYGTPLKFTYLPKISQNINRAKMWFRNSMEKHNYDAKYFYCYCTKSSHFEYVMNEAFKNNIHIETSSAFDINIAIKTPVTRLPANNPPNASTPNNNPTAIGDTTAKIPGRIISLNAAEVLISTHLAYSGVAVPSIIPGISLNCLLTSSIIAYAALPTASIVKAENKNGNIPPINIPAITTGFVTSILVSCTT